MKKTILFALAFAIAMLGTGCKSHQNEPTQKQKTYKYDFFDEPCLNWGAGQATVRQWMLQHGFTYFQSSIVDGESILYYNPKKNETITALGFNNFSGYEMAIVYILASEVSINEMDYFLSERYERGPWRDNMLGTYRTKDNLTDVEWGLTFSNGIEYYTIYYTPAN